MTTSSCFSLVICLLFCLSGFAIAIQPYRTGYHFQPQKDWMNDPCAPMHYKQFYHLFYQYIPNSTSPGPRVEWGHAVSKDMMDWIHLEPAIRRSKPYDNAGAWSGSATILPGDKPVILYMAVVDPKPAPGYQVQAYAVPANYSDPYLREWIKPDDNPIIKPTHENVSAFRDPTTAWFSEGHWKIIIGSRHNNRGVAYLYRIRDFKVWIKTKHPLHSRSDTGMWECPDFFPVSTLGSNGLDASASGKMVKHVLKVSLDVTRYEYYTIGKYDHVHDRYIPNNTLVDGWAGLRYDYGNLYASKSFYDPVKKRRILWGWSNDSSTAAENKAKGWSGIQVVPRKIWMHHSGKHLVQWPIREVEKLRQKREHLRDVKVNKGEMIEIEGITATQADVEVTFTFSSLDKAEPYDRRWGKIPQQDLGNSICGVRGATIEGGVEPFGLLALASQKLEEYTPIFFRVFKVYKNKYVVLLCSDATPSSLNPDDYKPSYGGFVPVDLTEKRLSLRSLIDHSVVESFAEGGKTVITSRVYPILAVDHHAHLYVFNNGSETIRVEKVDAWSMKSANISTLSD